MNGGDSCTRRDVLAGAVSAACAPAVLRAPQPLELRFLTIPDPDGWHPSLRLKGDWLVVEISDGIHSGYGEASHSRDEQVEDGQLHLGDAPGWGIDPTAARALA